MIVAEKTKGNYNKLTTIGIANDESEVEMLMSRGRQWISDYRERLHPTLDFDGRAEAARERERQEVERVVSSRERSAQRL